MSPSYHSLFINGYLEPNQVALGRLVLDMKNLGQDFYPSSPPLSKEDISSAPFSNLKSLSNANSSFRFKAALSKLLQVFADKTKTTVDDIETRNAVRYQLLNVSLNFEGIFEDEGVKRWLEKVVLTGAKHRSGRIDGSWGGIQVLVGDNVLPGASAVAVVGELMDAKLEGGYTSKTSLGASFVTARERIIAVQYQEVVFKMSSSKGGNGIAEAGVKKKTFWKSFGAARGGTELDTLEAILAEETTMDNEEDVDVQAISTEDGEVFVILD